MRTTIVGARILLAAVLVTGRVEAGETERNTAPDSAPTAAAPTKEELEIIERLRAYEQQLDREHRELQQRLAHAGQLRQKGLARNDRKLLEQAERMERRAVEQYEARLRQFEQFSTQLAATSARDAEETEARGENARHSPPPKKAEEKQADERPFRLFRRLRD